VRAVNLIPREGRRGSGGPSSISFSPTYVVLGVLVLALVFVTVDVLSTNTISSRKAKLASLQAQVTQEQALATRLNTYTQFAKLEQTRAETVREIAATRFDWYGVLSDLAKAVPANTSLQSLYGSVAPGAAVESSGSATSSSGASSSLRGDLSVPAVELTGCTKTQDDVAALISRLRVINGVTRVTLGDSQKPTQSGGALATASSTSTGGCGPNAPSFDLVVFFNQLPNAGPTGYDTGTTATPASTSTSTTSTTSTTPASTTTTTPASTTTTTPASTTSTTPVSTTTSGG
jgi:Tfp pilus assembly protein PilN